MTIMSEYFSVAADAFIRKSLDELQAPNLDHVAAPVRRDILKRARQIATNDTFGVGHKVKDGKPVEQGLGSFENPTLQSIEAYIANQTKRQPVPDADYEETLRKMRERLAVVEGERRKAAAAAEDEAVAL
jgi:hypothetical protein